MFGWRKKNDGFVWNEYVRTTILLRREQRKQRIEDVRDAAVDGIKQVGRQGVALGVAGASAAGRGSWSAIKSAAAVVFDWVCVIATACWLWLADRAQPLTQTIGFAGTSAFDALKQPAAATPLLLVAAVATLSASVRWSSYGLDRDAMIAAAIAGLSLLLAAIPWALSRGLGGWAASVVAALPYADRFRPGSAASGAVRSALGIGAMLALGVGAISWLGPALMSHPADGLVAAKSATVITPASGHIEGKATAIGPGELRIGSDIVHLSGVEAPAAGQPCAQGKPCATAAKAALQKLIAGKRVSCEVSGRHANNATSATCQINGADLAGQLVRGGHLFAASGLFATYASAEREARANKVGIWRTNDLRPAQFRAKVWDDAKQAAPNGCPIKGSVAGETKTYHLPGAQTYDKAKVRPERGERWFCTEAEARAAGWKQGDAS